MISLTAILTARCPRFDERRLANLGVDTARYIGLCPVDGPVDFPVDNVFRAPGL